MTLAEPIASPASPWNADTDAELQRQLADGASAREAAHAISLMVGRTISRSAVIGRSHRKGFDFQAPPGRPPAPRLKFRKPRQKPQRRELRKMFSSPAIVPDPTPSIPANESACAVLLVEHQEGQCRWPLWTETTPVLEREY